MLKLMYASISYYREGYFPCSVLDTGKQAKRAQMKERDVFSELLEGMTEWREFNAEMKRCDRTVAVLNLSCLRDGQKGRAPAAPAGPR
jgi:hypothetical protein